MPEIDVEKLYSLAGDQAERLAKELFEFDYFLRKHYEIFDFLIDNSVDNSIRKEILDQLTQDHSSLLKQLTDLLLTEELLYEFSWLTEKFLRLVQQRQNIYFAELRTAFSLENEELDKIKKTLGINLRYKIIRDEKLLGGFILKYVDGRVLDASLKGQLEKMKVEIAK